MKLRFLFLCLLLISCTTAIAKSEKYNIITHYENPTGRGFNNRVLNVAYYTCEYEAYRATFKDISDVQYQMTFDKCMNREGFFRIEKENAGYGTEDYRIYNGDDDAEKIRQRPLTR